MKVPDLSSVEEAGVSDWEAPVSSLEQAAKAAKLKWVAIDLGSVKSKNALLEALYRGLKLPEHFGHNWDALADVLMDDEWADASGYVIVLKHATKFQHDAPDDFETAWEIFADASEYWKEHKKPFWVFAA
jgi:RNAse (barnase) inhibitor barstar